MDAVLLLALAAAVQSPARDSAEYLVWNHGRRAGEMQVVTTGDSVAVHYYHIDRQRGPKVDAFYRLGAGGRPVWSEVRAGGSQSSAAPSIERYEVRDDSVRWWAGGDTTAIRSSPGIFYIPRSTTVFDDVLLARHLLRRPERSAPLAPAGTARMEIAAETTLAVGGKTVRVRLAAIDGTGLGPSFVWLDEKEALFASGAGWFIAVRRGAEAALPALRSFERRYLERRDAALATRLEPKAAGAILIRDGDVFDSERGIIRPRTSVVVTGNRITAVGPADSIRIPAGATIIDATGKTVIPGMWDMHTHVIEAQPNGILQLAAGITTVRDMAADIDVATSLRDRADRGTVVAPRMVLAGFIEGPGKWAGPTEVLVRNEDEARAWVARYDSLGYKQIKLYNLVHPDLVPVIAEEAHKRGMRLSGHIPRGLTVTGAVRLGFDEFQHAAFLFSTFFQDSLYTSRMRAYSDVAALVSPAFNVDAPEVTALITFLRERGTVVDGTFNIWQDRSRALPDGTDPVFGPTLAWLPPLERRGIEAGRGGSSESIARAQASSAAYRRMLKRLFDAGVTIVPGTDNVAGLSFHGELEIYERSGIPAPNVLQIATIVPARVMKQEKDYGSIAVGKVADLAIVAGRPAERITDLRKTETVMRAGRVYSTRALYDVLGIEPKN
ncbi:MAG: amidohydrolase family protein [Gemmatimonadota bacterium]